MLTYTGFATLGVSHAPRNLHGHCLLPCLRGAEHCRSWGEPAQARISPKLSDAEALTMAFVGTVLGYQSDKAVWKYFLRHLAAGFPNLGDRSTFVRRLLTRPFNSLAWQLPKSQKTPCGWKEFKGLLNKDGSANG